MGKKLHSESEQIVVHNENRPVHSQLKTLHRVYKGQTTADLQIGWGSTQTQ
jgi:hypothetical protein